jgi:hypothetical protein
MTKIVAICLALLIAYGIGLSVARRAMKLVSEQGDIPAEERVVLRRQIVLLTLFMILIFPLSLLPLAGGNVSNVPVLRYSIVFLPPIAYLAISSVARRICIALGKPVYGKHAIVSVLAVLILVLIGIGVLLYS